jgi:hypothetical protein
MLSSYTAVGKIFFNARCVEVHDRFVPIVSTTTVESDMCTANVVIIVMSSFYGLAETRKRFPVTQSFVIVPRAFDLMTETAPAVIEKMKRKTNTRVFLSITDLSPRVKSVIGLVCFRFRDS